MANTELDIFLYLLSEKFMLIYDVTCLVRFCRYLKLLSRNFHFGVTNTSRVLCISVRGACIVDC